MGQDIDPVLELERQRSEAATTLDFLHSPRGNRLETLAGKREGQHSIRTTINGAFALNGAMKASSMWRLSITTEETP